jgi:hypothetical protein
MEMAIVGRPELVFATRVPFTQAKPAAFVGSLVSRQHYMTST